MSLEQWSLGQAQGVCSGVNGCPGPQLNHVSIDECQNHFSISACRASCSANIREAVPGIHASAPGDNELRLYEKPENRLHVEQAAGRMEHIIAAETAELRAILPESPALYSPAAGESEMLAKVAAANAESDWQKEVQDA